LPAEAKARGRRCLRRWTPANPAAPVDYENAGASDSALRKSLGECNRGSAANSQDLGSVAFVDGDLDIAAGADKSHRFSAFGARKRVDQALYGLRAYLQFEVAVGVGSFRKILTAKIGDQVAERIDAENHAFDHA